MKLKNILLAGLLAIAPSLALGQTTTGAKSKVVGYETLELNPGFNYVGIRLQNKTLISGTFETIGTSSVSDTGADFTAALTAGKSHILEINDGSGNILVVDTWSGDTITTSGDLSSAGVASGAEYAVREIDTVASIFGADGSSLTKASTSAAADEIWIPNTAGGFNKYYFYQFFSTIELRNVNGDTAVDPTTIGISYDQGFLVKSVTGQDVVIEGEVKTTPTAITLDSGFNYVGTTFPAGATIATAFGAANETGSLTAASTSAAADEIWIPTATGFNKYYFYNFFSTTEFRDISTDTEVDATTIILTPGLIIKAASAKSALNTQPSNYNSL